MKYTFNNTSLVSGYIKELLKDFNLPTCKVYNKEKFEGAGYPTNKLEGPLYTGIPLDVGRAYLSGNYFYLSDGKKLRKLDSFELGLEYPGVTKNLVIKSNYYDSYTHEYLGEYLRFIRDYKGIDLMPLYNCYSNVWTTSLNKYYVKAATRQKYNITNNGYYVYHMFPVKFFEKYTVSLACDVPVEMFLLLSEDSDLNSKFISGIKSADGVTTIVPSSLKKYSNIQKNKPVIYDTYDFSLALSSTKDYSTYWTHEENLKMVIKLPSWVKTSITVLEGDYRINTSCLGDTFFPEFPGNVSSTSTSPFTKLSLLENVSTQSYPFADRLVEYLFNLPITKNNIILNNVGRIQKKVYSRKEYTSGFKGYFDLFDDTLRDNLYTIANQHVVNLNSGEYKVKKLSNFQLPLPYDPQHSDRRVISWKDVEADDRYLYSSLVDRKPDILYWVDKDVEGLVDSL